MTTSAAIAQTLTPFQKSQEEISDSFEGMSIQGEDEAAKENIDVAQHFHVVGAFDMPRYVFDENSNTFYKSKVQPAAICSATEKGEMYRNRLKLIKQRILRNETFCPPTMNIDDNDNYVKLTSIKSLIGRDKKAFVIFGMLTQLEEGKIYLEDEDANIELVLNNATYDYGLFTDGCFVIVEGVYGEDHRFHVQEIHLPPAEPRDISDVMFGHVDFLGLPKPLVDENLLKLEEKAHGEITFVIMSDVHLDQPRVMDALRQIFAGYAAAQIPLAFIMMGNFTSQDNAFTGTDVDDYKDNFSALADLINEHPLLATHSNWVFVPGPKDPWAGTVLPRAPILPSFVPRMRQKVRKVHFTTNPCRIRYCTQDIVVFREDWMQKMWRNTLLSTNLEADNDPVNHFVHTIVDQGHLCPLPLSVKPVMWAFDNALSLYPLPHALIIADKYENYGISYEGTTCINPGSLLNSDFTWSIYYPSLRVAEKW
ncbi:DNA polymerase alpha/epsilon subunit B-domain-containing protein [Mycotypha africana]|uniref:DNA polymerase alpha/epsilon subunit B-domain-containing protein n=1 Tax=Mycotypha africana TaxID=64632 RepID=UPI002300FFE7|nr:DNA polymerase alpha/epsilon subunit B-domain-containing protein [Mycotypha africana]KAI8991954.1 DNA polymerase alpha/epsilon subunit B-domain-containing protein [Mycotypha africana]